MIKEEYVSYESAKLLKEAGFPQEGGYDCFFDKEDVRYSIPKQSQAMRWLREEHKISVEQSITFTKEWALIVFVFNEMRCIMSMRDNKKYTTYEAAAEAGIQAACEYLIEKGGEG